MAYRLADLPYDYSALEPHYKAEMLELHHSRHHAKYVQDLNDTLDRLETARAQEDFRFLVGLEQTLAFNLSGHVLHSLFWKNLSPEGGDAPEGELAAAIDEHFGSFDGFRMQLSKAVVSVQGSGWGALSWEPLDARLVVQQIHDHQGNAGSGTLPLLVIDGWEHAYYLQYKNRRDEYVEALWNVVDWSDVEARFARARGFSLV